MDDSTYYVRNFSWLFPVKSLATYAYGKNEAWGREEEIHGTSWEAKKGERRDETKRSKIYW